MWKTKKTFKRLPVICKYTRHRIIKHINKLLISTFKGHKDSTKDKIHLAKLQIVSYAHLISHSATMLWNFWHWSRYWPLPADRYYLPSSSDTGQRAGKWKHIILIFPFLLCLYKILWDDERTLLIKLCQLTLKMFCFIQSLGIMSTALSGHVLLTAVGLSPPLRHCTGYQTENHWSGH